MYVEAIAALLKPNNTELQRNAYDIYFSAPYFRVTVARGDDYYVELVGYKPRLIGYDTGWFQYIVFSNDREVLCATKPIEVPPTNEVCIKIQSNKAIRYARVNVIIAKAL